MAQTAKKNGSDKRADAEQQHAQVNVLGQYIKDLSFENPNSPEILKGQIKGQNLKINFNVIVKPIEENIYEVALALEANARTDDTVIYNIELIYAGAFMLKNLPSNAIQPFLYIECPALLFPFVRRLLADLTREGGFPPLLLDPIDFAGLYRQNMMRQQNATVE